MHDISEYAFAKYPKFSVKTRSIALQMNAQNSHVEIQNYCFKLKIENLLLDYDSR